MLKKRIGKTLVGQAPSLPFSVRFFSTPSTSNRFDKLPLVVRKAAMQEIRGERFKSGENRGLPSSRIRDPRARQLFNPSAAGKRLAKSPEAPAAATTAVLSKLV
jgi:hypothetical protein